jgi:hypothetical protein
MGREPPDSAQSIEWKLLSADRWLAGWEVDERWFQIVVGRKFEFDEAASEELDNPIPLPQSLAQSLAFDLRRFILKPGPVLKIRGPS